MWESSVGPSDCSSLLGVYFVSAPANSGLSGENGSHIDLFVNYMYLDCRFIPAHVFMCTCVLVFVLKDRNIISLYEIIQFA